MSVARACVCVSTLSRMSVCALTTAMADTYLAHPLDAARDTREVVHCVCLPLDVAGCEALLQMSAPWGEQCSLARQQRTTAPWGHRSCTRLFLAAQCGLHPPACAYARVSAGAPRDAVAQGACSAPALRTLLKDAAVVVEAKRRRRGAGASTSANSSAGPRARAAVTCSFSAHCRHLPVAVVLQLRHGVAEPLRLLYHQVAQVAHLSGTSQ